MSAPSPSVCDAHSALCHGCQAAAALQDRQLQQNTEETPKLGPLEEAQTLVLDIHGLTMFYAWALAADGQRGVRSVLRFLEEELENAMIASGCRNLDAVQPDLLQSSSVL